MSTGLFLAILALAIVALMVTIIKYKMHPVLALFTVSLVTGILLGYGTLPTVKLINDGFGGTLGSIGITIIIGSIIAMGIEDTGAAKSIANFFIRLFRGRRMELAPSLTAFIMSIPVFGDITMVLTAPIASMISIRKKISMSTMAAFTGLGLFLTHAMVPPTPGILAIAILMGADLGLTIAWGFVLSLIAFFVTWFILKRWTAKEWIAPREDFVRGVSSVESDNIEDILIREEGLPGVGTSFMPLLLPVVLISFASFTNMYIAEGNVIRTGANIVGDRVIALFIGLVYSVYLGYRQRQSIMSSYKALNPLDEKTTITSIMLDKWVVRGLTVALLPLLVTGMGGAFGAVLKASPAIKGLSALITSSSIMPVLVPWGIGVIMMTAVGSMTMAGMTAAAIVHPMLGDLGLSPLMATLSIGAGTLMFNHVNNSGFWVMGQFFNLDTKQSIKYVTVPCVVASIVIILLMVGMVSMGMN